MGTSHFDSDVAAKGGDETITGFAHMQADRHTCATLTATQAVIGTAMSAPTMTATTLMQAKVVKVTNKVQLGNHLYVLFGAAANQAAVEAAATAVDASCKGSLYVSTGGTIRLWVMTADDTAASVSVT